MTFARAYASPPNIQLTCVGVSGGPAGLVAYVSAKSTTGFTISVSKTAAGGVAYDWNAIGNLS